MSTRLTAWARGVVERGRIRKQRTAALGTAAVSREAREEDSESQETEDQSGWPVKMMMHSEWSSWMRSRPGLRRVVAGIESDDGTEEDPEVAAKLREIFKDNFWRPGMKLGNITVPGATEDMFKLVDGFKPWFHKPRRFHGDQGKFLNWWVKTSLEAGIIRRRKTTPGAKPVNTRVLLVAKTDEDGRQRTVDVTTKVPQPDGSMKEKKETIKEWRICHDFRDANVATVKMVAPPVDVHDTLNQLGQGKLFCSLDAHWCWFQVPIAEEDKWKTSFIVKTDELNDAFEFCCTPMGATNSTGCWNNVAHAVFGDLIGREGAGLSRFSDDTQMYARTAEEMYALARELSARLTKYNVYLSEKKSRFGLSAMRVLGYRVGPEGLQSDPAKVEAVRSFERPLDVKQLEVFTGLTGYYRRLVPNYGSWAQPLNALKADGATGSIVDKWTQLCEESFQYLKRAITTQPVVKLPDFHKPFTVATDASPFGLGACLSQEFEDGEHPVAFASRGLKGAEYHYSTTELELMGVQFGLRAFKEYLGHGATTKVITDARNVWWLYSRPSVRRVISGKLERLLLELQDADIELVHRPGKDHANADGPSRNHPSLPRDYDGKTGLDGVRILGVSESGVGELTTLGHYTRPTIRDFVGPMGDAVAAGALGVAAVQPAWSRTGASSTKVVPDGRLREAVVSRVKASSHLAATTRAMVRSRKQRLGKLRPEVKRGAGPVDERQRAAPPTAKEVYAAQVEDPWCRKVFERYVALGDAAVDFGPERATHMRYKLMRVEGGDGARLLTVVVEGSDRKPVPVAPKSLRDRVIFAAHAPPMAAHQAVWRTFVHLRQEFWWPGIYRDVEQAVGDCLACEKQRVPTAVSGPDALRLAAVEPFQVVHMDFVGPLEEGESGAQYLLTLVDRFSRFIVVEPVHAETAVEAAAAFVKRWVCIFGTPTLLVTDRGSAFNSEFFKSTADWLWVNHVMTAAYHQNANGAVERMHRTLKESLRKLCEEDHTAWEQVLPLVVFGLNTTPSRTTGLSPHEIVFGRPARWIFDRVGEAHPSGYSDVDAERLAETYGHRLNAKLARVWRAVRDQEQGSLAKRAKTAFRKHKVAVFRVGDLVWRRNSGHKGDPARMVGPYEVMRDVTHDDTLGRYTGRSFRLRCVWNPAQYLQKIRVEDLRLFRRRRTTRRVAGWDEVCAACGIADGHILECVSCSTVEHWQCAGYSTFPAETYDKWVCEYCRAERTKPRPRAAAVETEDDAEEEGVEELGAGGGDATEAQADRDDGEELPPDAVAQPRMDNRVARGRMRTRSQGAR